MGLARLPKSWVLRRRDGRLRQSWPRISSWETRCLSELVLRVMPRTFHLLLGPTRIPSGKRLYFCGQGPVCPQKYKIIVHCNFYFVPSFNASRGTNCSSQPSMVHWLSSPIFPFVCSLSRHGDILPNLHFYFP